ncbi:MAG: GTPase Era [Gammaproteobacteria bacterium]|nr:GTPase Era [Gammaproteobacteria bacterium]
MTEQPATRCGYVAIVGRPNVGKSTLLNRILGQKISITSKKPQTTRHRILGIFTEGDTQIIYVDTPGLHREEKRAINRYMNRAAASTLNEVDAVVFVVDGLSWKSDDQMVLEKLKYVQAPVVLWVNKADQVKDKERLLPHLQWLAAQREFKEIIPGSARQGRNVDTLQRVLSGLMPVNAFYYAEDQVTDRSVRFLTAEIVREKIMRNLGDEVPYSVSVEIEKFQANERGIVEIIALILVERDGQKAILIGEKGERLKTIGRDARIDMEKMLDQKVFLQLWVKVKEGWADDERALQSLGYSDR